MPIPALAEDGGGLDHFVFANISDQTAGQSFQITITAKDSQENTITDYSASCNLTASQGNILPNQTSSFANGVWTGNITIDQPAQNVTITVNDTGAGVQSQSNTFNVIPGGVGGGGGYFTLGGNQPSLMLAAGDNTTIDINITSMDGFTGTVNLELFGPNEIESYNDLSQSSVTLDEGETETVTLTLGISPAMPSGMYGCRVEGASGLQSMQWFFDVTVGATGQPLLMVVPRFVNTVDAVNFSVMNFTPDTNIDIEWKTGPLKDTVITQGTTDSHGSWASNPVIIPPGQGLAGGYDIRAKTQGLEERAFTTINIVSSTGEDFFVFTSPSHIALGPGDNITVNIKIESMNGFSSPVTLSANALVA